MKRTYIFVLALVVFTHLPAFSTIINIPDDYETIQEGIDASTDGDTVLVQPETYVENINFNGHEIVLGSMFLTTGDPTYISQTIIDGGFNGFLGPVVVFESGEDIWVEIVGFTIQNGHSDPFTGEGGGIRCWDSNPTIRNNIIKENLSMAFAFGPDSITLYPIGRGGGIFCYNSDALIIDNSILDNSSNETGGGISCNGSSPVISKNLFSLNRAPLGGAIHCEWHSNSAIINNTISDNEGGGIFCSLSSDPIIINTILWADSAQNGSEIDFDDSSSPTLTYCNIQGGWEGEGNIDIDPLFRDPENGDFHLMSTACGDPNDSPCIDAGHPDILDSLLDCSWGLGGLRSDMGAYAGGDSVTVSIDNGVPEIPNRFALAQNYPNPFNASTIINYTLPEKAVVSIEIYDRLGRKVETLIQAKQPAGYHQVVWDASDHSSGMYFYRIEAGEYSDTKKMVLLK
jgi:parallel beta-helix repeat protein